MLYNRVLISKVAYVKVFVKLKVCTQQTLLNPKLTESLFDSDNEVLISFEVEIKTGDIIRLSQADLLPEEKSYSQTRRPITKHDNS